MSENTVYLVTGGNRGIGRGLVTEILSRPKTTVIAATRDPNASTSQSLKDLPKGDSSSLFLIKIDASSETDAGTAIQTLKSEHGITKLDVVIANAGIYPRETATLTMSAKDLREAYEVNSIGQLVLFQATHELLMKSKKPKLVFVSSQMGSVEWATNWEAQCAAYGSSKAALNYLVRRIHFETPGLITFPIHPGWVQTDMGNTGAKSAGLEQAPVTIPESVRGIMEEIDKAEREKVNFASYNHSDLPW